MEFPDPLPGAAVRSPEPALASPGTIVVSLAVAAGSALLGVAAGFVWAAVAPRALLVMTGPGAAGLVNVETDAFIAADGAFCLIALAGGVISGALGYLLGVRRHGPLAVAGVLAGAVAAAFLARWIGEQSGLGTFHHLLATLPAGAHLRDSLTLGASGALAFWPLAAGLVAGGLEAFLTRSRGRHGAGRPVLAGLGPDLGPPLFPGSPAPGGHYPPGVPGGPPESG